MSAPDSIREWIMGLWTLRRPVQLTNNVGPTESVKVFTAVKAALWGEIASADEPRPKPSRYS